MKYEMYNFKSKEKYLIDKNKYIIVKKYMYNI